MREYTDLPQKSKVFCVDHLEDILLSGIKHRAFILLLWFVIYRSEKIQKEKQSNWSNNMQTRGHGNEQSVENANETQTTEVDWWKRSVYWRLYTLGYVAEKFRRLLSRKLKMEIILNYTQFYIEICLPRSIDSMIVSKYSSN